MAAVSSIDLQISRLKNLPELPAAGLTIIDAVSDPDIAIEELARILSISPVLVTRLLGLANSAYFGCAEPIKDIQTAIIRVLGLNLVKSLALGILLNLALDTSKCHHFKCEKLWFRGLATASLAQKLSRLIADKSVSPVISYTGGLLLNIGLIAAVHLFPDETEQALLNAERNAGPVAEELKALLGYDHYEIGSILLEHWHLPVLYQTLLKEFNNTAYTGAERKFIAFLSLCSKLAKKIMAGEDNDLAPIMTQMETFGITTTAMRPVFDELSAKKEHIYLAALAISGK